MSLTDRICVVGAGAAGLSASHYLTRRGYDSVTVFEAADRVGGKCHSLVCDGRAYDLGAFLVGPGCTRVIELAERHRVPFAAGPPHRLADLRTASTRPLGRPDFASPASYPAMARLLGLMALNQSLKQPGIRDLKADLVLPIGRYVERHRLSPVEDLLLPAFTGCGFGYADDIPAAYLLKLLYLALPGGLDGVRRWLRACRQARPDSSPLDWTEPLVFRDGHQSLFEAIASMQDIRLDSRVTRIERSGSRVSVTVSGEVHHFDKIILCVEPRQILEVLDASEEEQDLLEQVRTLEYHVLLGEFDGPPAHCTLFIRDNLGKGRRGRPVVFSRTHPEGDLCLVYAQGGDGVTVGAVERRAAEDLRRLGSRLKRVVAHRKWSYFPHLPSAAMVAFYGSMEGRQGKENTYFAGEVMNFSTVEGVVAYSRDLVERFF